MAKNLHASTDFYDDIAQNRHFFDADQIRGIMSFVRSLGCTTIDWIVDDMWALYEAYPQGFDLLQTAVDAAHAEGLKIHAVYKPTEGQLQNIELPHTMPRPEGAVVAEDLRGLFPIVRPFVAAHPEMCLKRAPGDEDPGGAITAVRIIKNDDQPVSLSPGDLSVWVGKVNGQFEKYEGEFGIEQTTEWRPIYSLGGYCRIVTLTGLNISPEWRYVEVRLADEALKDEAFENEYQNLVELVNDKGESVPSTIAVAEPPREVYTRKFAEPVFLDLTRYGQLPEVRAWLADDKNIAKYAGEMRAYARATFGKRTHALHEKRMLSIARGKLPHLSGILNPVYPEVRQHWLEAVQFCLDCGVDAVNIRPGNHGRFHEEWLYGFNEPVLEALDGRIDYYGARRVMGQAYTQFMREARDLVHKHGKKFGVHLMSNYLRPRDETADNTLHQFEIEWETWIAELADFATFRGSFGYRPETVKYIVDRFGDACLDANVPLIFQSNRRVYGNTAKLQMEPWRVEYLRREMAWALEHPAVAAYELYETANFMKIIDGKAQGVPQLREVAAEFGFCDKA